MDDIKKPQGVQKPQTKLEQLQKKLYKKDFDQSLGRRHSLDQKDYDLKDNWKTVPQKNSQKDQAKNDEIEYEPPKKGSIFNVILGLAAVFFVISVSYAGFIFLNDSKTISGDDVDIEIIGPVSIGAGDTLSLDVILTNNNPVPLEVVDLIVQYPSGTKDSKDLVTGLNRTRETIEDIASGSVVRKTLDMSLFGQEGEIKNINIGIEYQVPGSNAVFDKNKNFEIALSAAPIIVNIDGLTEISSGQIIPLKIELTSNSQEKLENIMLVGQYPFGFKFEEANIDPKFDDNIWVFDSLEKGETKTIEIKGRIEGQNDEDKVFRFNTGLVSENNREELGVIFTSMIHDLVVKKPFVAFELSSNRSLDSVVTANSGSQIPNQIVFTNNTNDEIRNVEIELRFSGNIYDETSVRAEGGFYDSIKNTLTFNPSTDPSLSLVQPRVNYVIPFDFSIKNLKQNVSAYSDPEIKIIANVKAQRFSSDNVESELSEDLNKTIKVFSDVLVNSFSLYSIGPFSNTGPIPPKAETDTTYTVTMSLSNTTNELSDAKITAILPNYVSWNNTYSPTGERVTYNSVTREVTWDIGKVRSGVGYLSAPRELSLQLIFNPSLSQVGTAPVLLKNTQLTAIDDFTGKKFNTLINNPSTELKNEQTSQQSKYVIE
jgi:hypothetical protein